MVIMSKRGDIDMTLEEFKTHLKDIDQKAGFHEVGMCDCGVSEIDGGFRFLFDGFLQIDVVIKDDGSIEETCEEHMKEFTSFEAWKEYQVKLLKEV
jgi:hypothetical protein